MLHPGKRKRQPVKDQKIVCMNNACCKKVKSDYSTVSVLNYSVFSITYKPHLYIK